MKLTGTALVDALIPVVHNVGMILMDNCRAVEGIQIIVTRRKVPLK